MSNLICERFCVNCIHFNVKGITDEEIADLARKSALELLRMNTSTSISLALAFVDQPIVVKTRFRDCSVGGMAEPSQECESQNTDEFEFKYPTETESRWRLVKA